MHARRQAGQRQLAWESAGIGTRGSSMHQQVFAPQWARHAKVAPHCGQRKVSACRLMGNGRAKASGAEGLAYRTAFTRTGSIRT
jgi:hypothetical protein